MRITHLYKATGAATGNVAVQLADDFSDQLQIDLEPQAAGAAGRVNVLFRTPGMSRLKALRGDNGNPVSIVLSPMSRALRMRSAQSPGCTRK